MTDADTLTRAADLIERLLYSGRDEIHDASDADEVCDRLREMAARDDILYVSQLRRDLNETVLESQQYRARITELEPLQEVVAQLEDEKRALRKRVELLLAVGEMLAAVTQGAKEDFVRVPYGASHEDVSAINEWHGMAAQAMAEWEALKENDDEK